MSEPLAMPELHEGTMDALRLAVYEAELAESAQVESVQLKGGSEVRARDGGGGGGDLAEAFAALQQGQVRGIQVRYRFEGEPWWDTVIALGAGFRLVRVRADTLPWAG